MSAKYLDIPINTIVSTGTLENVVGANTSVAIATGNNAAVAVSGQLNDTSAAFTTDGVVPGDILYNVTDNSQVTISGVTQIQLSFAGNIFPGGSESYAVRKSGVLQATGSLFTTRKVRVGDIVKNTTAATETTVSALMNETSLALTVDIFNSPTLFDDGFTIDPPLTEVYANGATFLTTITIGDVYENTTQNFSEIVTSIIDDFRFKCGSTVGTIGDAYNVFDSSVASSYLVLMDQIVLVDRVNSEQSRIFLNITGQTNNYITIDHSDQGTGRAVAIAIQNTMKRGFIGVNLPDPPGPSAARVQMPIFEGSVITVESIVLS